MIKVLQTHIDGETREGNLDSAIAIRNVIAELKDGTEKETKTEDTEKDYPSRIGRLTPENLAGTYWEEKKEPRLYIYFVDETRFRLIRPAGSGYVERAIEINGDRLKFSWGADTESVPLRFNQKGDELELSWTRKFTYELKPRPDSVPTE
ncbi:MAG: hypothetical protein ABF384_18640 [Verrucomicrobiales bacterium]